MLLTDEEIKALWKSNLASDRHSEAYMRITAKAQLKKVVEEMERQIGMYSRTGDDGRIWLPIDELRQSILDEVK